MSEDTSAPAEPAPETVPKARLDEAEVALAAAEGRLAEVADALLGDVPEHLRGLVPEGLAPADRIAWFQRAKATGVFGRSSEVPETDAAPPKVTPKERDLSQLPPVARIAAAYRRR